MCVEFIYENVGVALNPYLESFKKEVFGIYRSGYMFTFGQPVSTR